MYNEKEVIMMRMIITIITMIITIILKDVLRGKAVLRVEIYKRAEYKQSQGESKKQCLSYVKQGNTCSYVQTGLCLPLGRVDAMYRRVNEAVLKFVCSCSDGDEAVSTTYCFCLVRG